MIILDTNVVSEFMRARVSKTVSAWLVRVSWPELHVTTITEAELFFGAERLPAGKQRRQLEANLEQMFRLQFNNRVLPFDSAAARNFAEIAVLKKRVGRHYHYPDTQIAAIARSRGAAVATRNVGDFEHCGIQVIDPWTA